MKRNKIESMLNNAINSTPLTSFEEISAKSYVKMREHDYITKQEEGTPSGRRKIPAILVFSCIILLLVVPSWIINYKTTDSIITLDVNPSVEIRTNHQNQVLFVSALNEDAKLILGENEFQGRKLEEVLALLMERLIDNNYLNSSKNTILLTVMNRNHKKADSIIEDSAVMIENSLVAKSITPIIMKQVITNEESREVLAKKYHVSEGRISFILDLLANNTQLSMDALVHMTMEQMYELAKDNSIDLGKYLLETSDSMISDAITGTAIMRESDQKAEDTPKSEKSDMAKSTNASGNERETSQKAEDKYEKDEAYEKETEEKGRSDWQNDATEREEETEQRNSEDDDKVDQKDIIHEQEEKPKEVSNRSIEVEQDMEQSESTENDSKEVSHEDQQEKAQLNDSDEGKKHLEEDKKTENTKSKESSDHDSQEDE